MQNELNNKYPKYFDSKSVQLQRYSICPIDVPSDHQDKKIIVKPDAINDLVDKIINTPLYYAEGYEGIPTKHNKDQLPKRVIGNAIGAGVYKDENGVTWVYGDYVVFKDANEDIVNNIITNKDEDDVGVSLDMFPILDDSNNVHNIKEYNGTSIIKKGFQAWRTERLVADNGATESHNVTITLDETLKQIVGENYSKQMVDKDSEIASLKSQIETAQKVIDSLKSQNQSLREVSEQITKLI